MKSINRQIQGEKLFVGIDLHKRRWHVTIRTADVEIFSCNYVEFKSTAANFIYGCQRLSIRLTQQGLIFAALLFYMRLYLVQKEIIHKYVSV